MLFFVYSFSLLWILVFGCYTSSLQVRQGSYVSGKCQGIIYFFKVRELSGNFMICQGKMKFCQNVKELSGNFAIPVMNAKKRLEQF